MDILLAALAAASAALSLIVLIIVSRPKKDSVAPSLEAMERRLTDSQNRWQEAFERQGQTQAAQLAAFSMQLEQKLENIRQMTERRLQAMQEDSSAKLEQMRATVDEKLQKTLEERLGQNFKLVSERLEQLGQTQAAQLSAFSMQVEQKLENIRLMTERQLQAMQEASSAKLEQMRATVDEKLQKTLEERLGQNFKLVSERLEQLHKGLGEMQSLAGGVDDLKRVLSGVKTRGILGEIQLGAILEQLLSPEQYETNVVTRPGSRQPVEFAVKMPGSGDETVLLPIDSKFPYDRYSALCDAYDSGDAAAVEAAAKELLTAVRVAAKDIRDKYVEAPYTTDFGILFLPFEGLYAEIVRRGMVETLQRDYKINITGPTTMGAFLNSLQMGFRTLAVQKRSAEVWTVLGQAKSEFDKFGGVLDQVQKKLEQTGSELEKLVGVRTRGIIRSLKQVESAEVEDSQLLME